MNNIQPFEDFEDQEIFPEPEYLDDIDICPECGDKLVEHHEMQGEVGFFEVIKECDGCGYTEA